MPHQMDSKQTTFKYQIQTPSVTPYTRIQPVPNGPIVKHFQPNRATEVNLRLSEDFSTDEYCVDRESVFRNFGWSQLGKTHDIPFLIRNNEKYCAVRMIEKYIANEFLTKISDNVYYGCTNILGYYLTVPESLLLNEINEFHCDKLYGEVPFKQGDVLVKLEEACEFYDFLTVVRNKLFSTPCNLKKCGFVTLNDTQLVPYVNIDDQMYVPRFYFDGMDGIKFKSKSIKGWDYSYLKFCFKVHGIREEFCKRDDCSVILLNDIMQYLDPSDIFKETWPSLSVKNKALYQPKKINRHNVKVWHEHPITVLPISTMKCQRTATQNRTISTTPSMAFRTISHN